jgi:hypothetical protein
VELAGSLVALLDAAAPFWIWAFPLPPIELAPTPVSKAGSCSDYIELIRI